MTVEDCVHGYFLLKGAILGGSNATADPTDDYYAGMNDTYAALKELILDFEGLIQQRRATSCRAYDKFREFLNRYSDDEYFSVSDICEMLDKYERED